MRAPACSPQPPCLWVQKGGRAWGPPRLHQTLRITDFEKMLAVPAVECDFWINPQPFWDLFSHGIFVSI